MMSEKLESDKHKVKGIRRKMSFCSNTLSKTALAHLLRISDGGSGYSFWSSSNILNTNNLGQSAKNVGDVPLVSSSATQSPVEARSWITDGFLTMRHKKRRKSGHHPVFQFKTDEDKDRNVKLFSKWDFITTLGKADGSIHEFLGFLGKNKIPVWNHHDGFEEKDDGDIEKEENMAMESEDEDDWLIGHVGLEDAATATKTARVAKGRNSFRFGRSKNPAINRASGSAGKTVPVRGYSSVEELERKEAEVLRLLEFYEDAVQKKIPDYLVGLATMILENVVLLSRDVDQMIHSTNSSEMSSLVANLNQSMADLVLWNDQFHLYGDDSHNGRAIESLISNVRKAVKGLVEFAVHKENQNSDFFLATKSNGSVRLLDSSQSSLKLNDSRNINVHGSMPLIPSYDNDEYDPGLTPLTSTPSKLAHSLSSDSILDGNDGLVTSSLPMKPPSSIRDDMTPYSYDGLAPPIPPKKNKNNHDAGEPSRHSYSPLQNLSFIEYSGYGTGPMIPPTCRERSFNQPSFETNSYMMDLSSALSQRCGVNSLRSFNSDNSFSSPEVSLLVHNSSSPLMTSSNSSSYSCRTKSSVSETIHAYKEANRVSSASDSLMGSSSSSSSQIICHNKNSTSQYLSVHRNSRSSTCSSSSRSSGSECESTSVSMAIPPPIPKKRREFSHCSGGQMSSFQGNNFPINGSFNSYGMDTVDYRHLGKQDINQIPILSATSSTSGLGSSKSSTISESSQSSVGPNNFSMNTVIQRRYQDKKCSVENQAARRPGEKPPLPIKQKHIIEYMQTFKDYQMPDKEWFANRRSQQLINSHQTYSVNYLGDEFKELELETLTSRMSLPVTRPYYPVVPPKRKPKIPEGSFLPFCDRIQSLESTTSPCPACSRNVIKDRIEGFSSSVHPQIMRLPTSEQNATIESNLPNHRPISNEAGKLDPEEKVWESRVTESEDEPKPEESSTVEETLLDQLNVDSEIVFKSETQESDVKAGTPDALLVFATYSKNGPYLEAFLTTYRTFLRPSEVISKLFYRYYKFVCNPKPDHQKAAKNAFSLLVRVVHDLVVPELTEDLLRDLAEFEYNLLSKGDLKLGLYFRKKLSEKLELRKRHRELYEFSSHFISLKDSHQYILLDFKSSDIADQMTLLDAELFNKVGIPELLHFSRDQNEDQCPNLKVFAMQINNMSSWVESMILRSAPQDREKYYKKFIKVMKHLRKVNNNFNSCIAILSGLESAAVCRLDWPKTSTDTLKEYRDLFGFERSYRAYRQALAETKPPCIPHLGIILQDLTKLHNVNPNNTNGKVNFLKRWLQFNILEDMKRFIPSKYELRRNETIINFINNFEDCMSEEDLWELSLSIKPQAKPK